MNIKTTSNDQIVTGITWALLLSFAALIGWTLYQLISLDRGMVIYRLESDTSRLASELFFNKMTALAQVTIALLGGMWAFLTLADTTVHIKGSPTIICFVLANLSLGASLAVYAYGYDFIVSRIFHHASFDIDAPFIVFVSTCQQILFLKGCLDIGFTITLGRRPCRG